MGALRHQLASSRHEKITKLMNLIVRATRQLTLEAGIPQETSQSPTHHQVEPNKDGEEECVKECGKARIPLKLNKKNQWNQKQNVPLEAQTDPEAKLDLETSSI